MKRYSRKNLVPALMISVFSAPAFSQPGPSTPPPLTKAQRETMAQAHEKMATCLRSTRTLEACHEEMRTACGDMGPACGMHMGPGMGPGMGHDKMGRHGGPPMAPGATATPRK